MEKVPVRPLNAPQPLERWAASSSIWDVLKGFVPNGHTRPSLWGSREAAQITQQHRPLACGSHVDHVYLGFRGKCVAGMEGEKLGEEEERK